MKTVEIISYSVRNEPSNVNKKFEIKNLENSDVLKARNEALELAQMLQEMNNTYRDIQLILHYKEINSRGEHKNKVHKVLNGRRMHTHEILKSLAVESYLLEKANMEFPKMITKLEEKEYESVNQGFITLYYFTA